LISAEEARRFILDRATSLGSEAVRVEDLFGRTLAAPVQAMIDLPIFSNSAVDGYAVAGDQPPTGFDVVGSVAAGDVPARPLEMQEAIRVFTGSMIPSGTTAVVMQEEATIEGAHVLVSEHIKPGQNIRWQGEEIKRGEVVFDPGVIVTPAVIGALSTLGYERVAAHKRPRVAIVGTGNELVSPGGELQRGQIFESNSQALSAAVIAAGGDLISVSHARDTIDDVKRAMTRGLTRNDVLITCGGVSVGEHDHVCSAATKLGVKEVFWQVAVKPGKPFYFGIAPNGQLVFGLPGNPVSALVVFLVFVRPALMNMLGINIPDQEVRAALGVPVKKQKGRMEFVRARAIPSTQLVVVPEEAQGSHMLTGLANATHLIHLPADVESLRSGEEVVVTPLQWSVC
jgi:molybdopterin molybdotransferase